MKCLHQFRFLREEPHGEDRVRKTYGCTVCGKEKTANLKKSRYSARKPFQPQSPTEKPKTRQKPPVRKRNEIRKRSTKRAGQEVQYAKLRKIFLEEHPTCQVCAREPSDQIHHRNHREGERLNDTAWWLAVGQVCHHRIHENPTWARENGYIVYDHEKDTKEED